MARGSKTVIFAALGGNAAIATVKFIAALFTGSSAMFSEAIHSAVDTGNQMLLLLGLNRSQRAPTQQHPFGFGLQLYFWAFVVAILIFGLGAGISAYEGVHKIMNPCAIKDAWINYAVLVIALGIEGTVWVIAFREFRRKHGGGGLLTAVRSSKDPMVFTVLFEDTAAVSGLIAAILGVFLSEQLAMPILDGVASLVIALILATTAGFLAYECQSLLTGEAASPEIRRSIRQCAQEAEGVECLNGMLSMHFGPTDIFVALSLDFDDGLDASKIEESVSALEETIKSRHPEVTRVFVEAQDFRAHRDSSEAAELQP